MITLTNIAKCDLAVLVGGVHVTIPRGGCSSFEVGNTFDDHPFVKEGWLTVEEAKPATRAKRSTKKAKKDAEPEQPEE